MATTQTPPADPEVDPTLRELLLLEVSELSYELDEDRQRDRTDQRARAYLRLKDVGVKREEIAVATGAMCDTKELKPRSVDWAIRAYRAKMLVVLADKLQAARERRPDTPIEDLARTVVRNFLRRASDGDRLAVSPSARTVELLISRVSLKQDPE